MNMYMNFQAAYGEWMKEHFKAFKVYENTVRLTLPYTDRNGEALELYLMNRPDGSSYMTDDGLILRDLKDAGFACNGEREAAVIQQIATSHGVTLTPDEEFLINCSESDLCEKINQLAQCMMKVSWAIG